LSGYPDVVVWGFGIVHSTSMVSLVQCPPSLVLLGRVLCVEAAHDKNFWHFEIRKSENLSPTPPKKNVASDQLPSWADGGWSEAKKNGTFVDD